MFGGMLFDGSISCLILFYRILKIISERKVYRSQENFHGPSNPNMSEPELVVTFIKVSITHTSASFNWFSYNLLHFCYI